MHSFCFLGVKLFRKKFVKLMGSGIECVGGEQNAGGAKIYLKREDLNHTGAHKINNALGQILLAKRIRRLALCHLAKCNVFSRFQLKSTNNLV